MCCPCFIETSIRHIVMLLPWIFNIQTEDFERFRHRNKSYICRIGDIINNGRFSIIAHLGRGAFGQVDKAQDLERPEAPPLAIKVYDRSFKVQASEEINILRDLRAKDPFDQYNVGKPTPSQSYPVCWKLFYYSIHSRYTTA
jgi:serine/threonine protein kinase